jgi:FtsP/CotA-like multicopper oxidase with cupredoxin domain
MTQTDGVTGPIIIHPKEKEPYDYDEERLLFLGDFFDQTSLQRCAGLKSDDFEWIGDPTSLLLNGKGLSQYCTNFNGTQPDGGHICLDSCSDTKKWTPSILIEAGKTYRFRFINAGGLVMQNIAINGHTMTVVNVDGTNVEPFEVDNLSIAVGQRYSVLVKADQYQGGDSETKNFWMQSVVVGRPSEGMPEGNWVLSYANSTDDVELPPDTQEKPNHPAWDDQTQIFTDFFNGLHTRNMSAHIEDQAALTAEESDIKRYQITITQAFDGTHLNWALNNISFVHPTSGMPLIGSAVEQSQRLGWPLPGPIVSFVCVYYYTVILID